MDLKIPVGRPGIHFNSSDGWKSVFVSWGRKTTGTSWEGSWGWTPFYLAETLFRRLRG